MRQLAKTIILLCIALNIIACGSDPDLQAIRTGIRNISVAAEKHDSDGIIAYVANDYRGVGVSREGVINLLESHFSYNKNINIIISDIEIMIAEDKKSAKVNVRMLMTGGDGNLPERGRLSAIKSVWEKKNDEWQVIRADWKPVLLNL